MKADPEMVMVDLAFWDDSLEQDCSWDDSGKIISGIWGTNQKFIGIKMAILLNVLELIANWLASGCRRLTAGGGPPLSQALVLFRP